MRCWLKFLSPPVHDIQLFENNLLICWSCPFSTKLPLYIWQKYTSHEYTDLFLNTIWCHQSIFLSLSKYHSHDFYSSVINLKSGSVSPPTVFSFPTPSRLLLILCIPHKLGSAHQFLFKKLSGIYTVIALDI